MGLKYLPSHLHIYKPESFNRIRYHSVGSVILLVFLLGSPAVFSACSTFSSGDPAVPDSTLSKVLVELHILSARHRRGLEPPPGLRDSVFQQYGVDSTDVHRTLQYYSQHPKKLEALYDGVIDSLRALETKVKRPRNSSSTR